MTRTPPNPVERLEPRRLMAATPALWAAGGGAYLTEFDPTTGAVLATVTPPTDREEGIPGGMAADAAGDLYVIDDAHGDLLRVDATTHVATLFEPDGAAGTNGPSAVTVAGDGSVFVIDETTLYRFAADGALLGKQATGSAAVGYNAGVAAGPDGLIYLTRRSAAATTTTEDDTVQRYTSDTLLPVGLRFASSPNYGNANRADAVGTTFGSDGMVYALYGYADPDADRETSALVVAFGTSGDAYTRNLGLAELDGSADTSANPIAVDAAGELIVVNAAGGIKARSAYDTTVVRQLVPPPASGVPYDGVLLTGATAEASPAAETVTARSPGVYSTSAGAVTVRLTGPGTAALVDDTASATGFLLTLTGTTAATAVTVAAPAGVTLDGLRSDGPVGTLSAPATPLGGYATLGGSAGRLTLGDLTGSLTVDGTVGRLSLGDVAGAVSITGTAVPSRVTVGDVAAGSSLTTAAPIASLSAGFWATGTAAAPSTISAPSIGTLDCRDRFGADVTLTSTGLSLARATVGSLAGADLAAAGSIGSVFVDGDVADSQVTADAIVTERVSLGDLTEYGYGIQLAASPGDVHARLGRFAQRPTGTFADSQIGAYTVGTVSIGFATSTAAQGQVPTGVTGHTIAAVRVPPLAGGRTLRHPAAPTTPGDRVDVARDGQVVIQIV